MLNNPMQLIGLLQNSQNPMMMIQQLMGNHPQYKQIMQVIQGKTPQQLEQYTRNLAKNSTNISSLECFNLKVNGCISNRVSGAPLPVQIIVNGTAVSLLNKYSLQILSNHIPRRSRGAYVVPPNNGTPYVILFDTPPCKCFA